MLALLGPRRLLRSLHSLPTRSLTTRPRRIPPYVSTWDPSRHIPIHPKEAAVERRVVSQDAEESFTRKAEREQWRDTQVIALSKCIDWRLATKRLNHCLQLADTKRADSDLRARLWRAYSLAKNVAPNLPSLIPDRAWDILWETQSIRSPQNRSRGSHLRELYRDMHSVGKSATVGQRIEYLESMFFNGKEEQALQEWEDDHCNPDPESRQDYKPGHLEVGVRMHAFADNADRAQEIMEELFSLYPTWDPAVMMAVFRAHTRQESEQHHDLANKIYLRMKALMGKNATLKDYDGWLVGFLEARHIRYAKQVFRDMIEDGYLACDYSSYHVDEVLRRLHLLYRLGTNIEKMTSIALYAITVLPQPYHTHLFGDWMKIATIQKAPEAAIQILEMMFRRGYLPETFHFNLLLRTLFRTKDKERELKAENIGWHMIDQFRKFPPERSNSVSTADAISNKVHRITETVTSSDAARIVPRANVTTFALIMQHHASLLQWEHVDYLARQLRELEVHPNATVMNVMMDNQCRQGKYNEVWKTFSSLTNAPDDAPRVFPDGASFRCLWKTLRLALGDHETRTDSALPTPRQLLAETLLWWDLCRSRYDAERFRMGLAAADHGAITNLMMHCFSYTKDLPGSLVALHVLRKRFDIFPSDKAARVLQKQTAWVDMHRDSKTVRTQYYHSGVNTQNVEKMGRVYHILMQNRFKGMNMTGEQYSYLNEQEAGDLGLNLLSEFVRVILKRQHPPEVVEAMIDEAKKEIGVPDLATGDMDAFSVA